MTTNETRPILTSRSQEVRSAMSAPRLDPWAPIRSIARSSRTLAASLALDLPVPISRWTEALIVMRWRELVTADGASTLLHVNLLFRLAGPGRCKSRRGVSKSGLYAVPPLPRAGSWRCDSRRRSPAGCSTDGRRWVRCGRPPPRERYRRPCRSDRAREHGA